jgi:phosphoglycolate phosphatase
MIEALRHAHFSLCIATSKLATMAAAIVDHAGWADEFTIIGGALPDGTRHLKTDVVNWTVDQLSDATAMAMVGDRAADMVGGAGAGLPGIGVSWGYGDKDELTRAGARTIADSPAQLVDVVLQIAPDHDSGLSGSVTHDRRPRGSTSEGSAAVTP